MTKDEVLKELNKEFNENINSHAFLVETDNLDECLRDVKEVICNKIAKNDEMTKRQIEEEIFLELCIVRPDGTEIKKDAILELQKRLKTIPIISDYLFYIIIPAESMNEIAANKLLKTIEEPNKNIIGFLVTQNSDILLPTIKSRCEKINLFYNVNSGESIDEELIELVDKMIKAIENKDHITYSSIKSSTLLSKENALIVENLLKDYYNTACNLKRNCFLNEETINLIKNNNSLKRLINKCKYLNKTFNLLVKNMNTDLLFEKVFIELKEM